jgi:DNA-binding Lrp family transcriptional regulator
VVQAYILIQTEVGRAAAVASEVAGIEGVTRAEDVTGPYDVIVHVEASDMGALGEQVVSAVQKVPGITRTLTCPVVSATAPSATA